MSEIYNFYHWSPYLRDVLPKGQSSSFVFERPQGEPFLLFICCEDVYVCDIKTGKEASLSVEVINKLTSIALNIKYLFSYYFAEALVFLDHTRDIVTFGMATNYLRASQYFIHFEDKIIQKMKWCLS